METVFTAGPAEPAIVGVDGPLEATITPSQHAGAAATQHALSITRYPHVRTQQLVQGSRWVQHTRSQAGPHDDSQPVAQQSVVQQVGAV